MSETRRFAGRYRGTVTIIFGTREGSWQMLWEALTDGEERWLLREKVSLSSQFSAGQEGLDGQGIAVSLFQDVSAELVEQSQSVAPQNTQLSFRRPACA